MPDSDSSDDDSKSNRRRRRLLFRATHRGTTENDRLIGGYVTARLAGLSDADMDALESVLELPEPDLADWLMGRLPIPSGPDSALLHAIRAAGGK